MAKARRTKLWFGQAEVQGILGRGEGESGEGGGEGEGEEMERAVEVFKMKGGQLWERQGGRQDAENDKIARELGLSAVYARLILRSYLCYYQIVYRDGHYTHMPQ